MCLLAALVEVTSATLGLLSRCCHGILMGGRRSFWQIVQRAVVAGVVLMGVVIGGCFRAEQLLKVAMGFVSRFLAEEVGELGGGGSEERDNVGFQEL